MANEKEKTYLGLDLGGTKLLIGEMSASGEILCSRQYPTGYTTQRETVEGILRDLADYLQTVGFVGKPAAVGAGLVGTSDHKNGIWRSLSHLPGDNIPLVAILEERLGVPAAIDNDVRSAATAELLLGWGRKSQDFIYLNVGTGLAAGFVTGGHVIRGARNMAGEIGHSVVDMTSHDACGCGRMGCCENVVSGMGFTYQARKLAPLYPGTRLSLPEFGKRVDVRELFQLAEEGDELCVRLVEQAVQTLNNLILNLVRFTDPDTFILGGGIIKSGWMLDRLLPVLKKQSILKTVEFVTSTFGAGEVGLVGAGALAMARERNI